MRFSPKALSFLRALKRNNNRDWFKARKDQYDALLRAPMIEMIERLALDFRAFAPDLVASPKASLYRIYRDTRFSANKAPLKTHVAAVFPCRGLPKHQGAGLYFEVAPEWVWVGGGMYAPDTSQLQAVREHIAANHRRLRAIVESPGFRRAVGRLDGEQLQRMPRGFPKDHRGRRVPEVPPVPRRPRVPGGFRHEPALLSGRSARVPADRAADAVSERAVAADS